MGLMGIFQARGGPQSLLHCQPENCSGTPTISSGAPSGFRDGFCHNVCPVPLILLCLRALT